VRGGRGSPGACRRSSEGATSAGTEVAVLDAYGLHVGALAERGDVNYAKSQRRKRRGVLGG